MMVRESLHNAMKQKIYYKREPHDDSTGSERSIISIKDEKMYKITSIFMVRTEVCIGKYAFGIY